MKKKIIFIISSGRSGSTVLCKFLGMHSQCFPLSEPQRYDKFLEKNGVCSCSEKVRECSFWAAVRDELESEGYPGGQIDTSRVPFHTGKGIVAKGWAYLRLLLFSKDICNLIEKKYYKQLNNEAQLLRAISKISGKPILVDASKSLARAIALSRLLKGRFEAHFIYLYRNPVPVVFSSLKKNKVLQLDDRVIVREKSNVPTLAEATKNWCSENKNNLTLTNIFNIKPTFICYETFTGNPEGEFDMIGAKLGLKWERDMLDLSQVGHHMISGNPSRVSAKRVNSPTDEWKTMDPEVQEYVRKRTQRILAKLRRFSR